MSARLTPPLWLWAVLLASTLASGWVALSRHRVEASARAVHVAVPIEDIRLIAAASGLETEQAFSSLQRAGMTAVIVGEETIDQLLVNGQMVAMPERPGDRQYYFSDPEVFERVRAALLMRFPRGDQESGEATGMTLRADEPQRAEFVFPAPVFELKNVGVGFNRALCDSIKSANLVLIGRVTNPPAASETSIRWVVEELAAVDAKGVIFTGDQVLGWEEQIEAASESLTEKNVWYGSVEFGKQAGDRQLKSKLIDSHLRVHSVQAAEMPQNSVSAILDRYVRAARERNIRVLLVRPPRPSDENPLASFTEFISKLRSKLLAEGSNARVPKPISAPDVPLLLRVIPAFGALLLGFWMWSRIATDRVLRNTGLAALAVLAGMIVIGFATGRMLEPSLKLSALAAALVFPFFAMVPLFSSRGSKGSHVKWTLAFFAVCGLSIIGGLHVAAMLTSLQYMVQVDQFIGVKAAHFLPPLLIGGYLLLEASGFRAAAGGHVTWLDVGIFTAIAAALGFTVLRTGNEAPGAVSGLELQFRDLLERFFPERPRTKEALVGHPALVIALGMAATGERRYLPLACLVAAIGQASIVNTFCHLHTPIEVSVVRVLTGVVVGGIVGLLVWVAMSRFCRGRSSLA